jgi:hypothetical protein
MMIATFFAESITDRVFYLMNAFKHGTEVYLIAHHVV